MTNKTSSNFLLTQMVLNNLDTFCPNLCNVQAEDLRHPQIYELWDMAVKTTIHFATLHDYLKRYNATKRNLQQNY